MNTIAALVLPGVIAGIFSAALTPLFRRLAFAVGAIDVPGPRKVHKVPIARLGGLGVVVAASAVIAVWRTGWGSELLRYPEQLEDLWVGLGFGLLPILIVSVWDDIRPLGAVPKLIAHLAGGCLAVAGGLALPAQVHVLGVEISLGVAAPLVSVIWLAALTNAFNIVDGLDGLAAGLALISSGSLVAVSILIGQRDLAAATILVAGAVLGFLPWNLHPAKVFLGDSGSAAMGFVLGALALKGAGKVSAGFAVLVPVVILGMPLAETVVSMARRLVRKLEGTGVRVMGADRGHFHHRLLDMGLGQRGAVLTLYGAGLLVAAVGLLSIFVSAQRTGLLLVAVLAGGLIGVWRLGYDEFALLRKGSALKVYETPVLKNGFFVVFVDLVIVAAAVWLSFALKYDDWGFSAHRRQELEMLAVLFPATVGVLWRMGMYRGVWRLSGLEDILRLIGAVGLATFLGLLVQRMFLKEETPISVFILYGLVKTFLSAGSRVSYRVLSHMKERGRLTGSPVALYGAGTGGALALRELWSNDALTLRPVAFLDDDPARKGTVLNGVKVVGGLEAVRDLAVEYPGLTVLVATTKIAPERLRQAARLCDELEIDLLRMELSFRECQIPEAEAPSGTGSGAPRVEG